MNRRELLAAGAGAAAALLLPLKVFGGPARRKIEEATAYASHCLYASMERNHVPALYTSSELMGTGRNFDYFGYCYVPGDQKTVLKNIKAWADWAGEVFRLRNPNVVEFFLPEPQKDSFSFEPGYGSGKTLPAVGYYINRPRALNHGWGAVVFKIMPWEHYDGSSGIFSEHGYGSRRGFALRKLHGGIGEVFAQS